MLNSLSDILSKSFLGLISVGNHDGDFLGWKPCLYSWSDGCIIVSLEFLKLLSFSYTYLYTYKYVCMYSVQKNTYILTFYETHLKSHLPKNIFTHFSNVCGACWILKPNHILFMRPISIFMASFSGVVPNVKGRVLSDDSGVPTQIENGLYVCGWLKRGPTGIIATNLYCAEETVSLTSWEKIVRFNIRDKECLHQ